MVLQQLIFIKNLTISVKTGKGAELKPIIDDGKIIKCPSN